MDVIFSCCLYGNNSRYIDPLFKNDLSKIRMHLGISCQFYIYCNSDVSAEIKERLKNHGYTIVVLNFNEICMGAMFVRYLPILEDLSEVVCIRDTDCCYSTQELDFIKVWLQSKYDFHIIRGHKLHVYPIMGGLFSIRGKLKSIFSQAFKENNKLTTSSVYNKDQEFLARYIYQEVLSSSLVHTVRLAFSKENVIHYNNDSNAGCFIGETIFNDNKRMNEKNIAKFNSELIVIPQLVSKIASNKIVARALTLICNR